MLEHESVSVCKASATKDLTTGHLRVWTQCYHGGLGRTLWDKNRK